MFRGESPLLGDSLDKCSLAIAGAIVLFFAVIRFFRKKAWISTALSLCLLFILLDQVYGLALFVVRVGNMPVVAIAVVIFLVVILFLSSLSWIVTEAEKDELDRSAIEVVNDKAREIIAAAS